MRQIAVVILLLALTWPAMAQTSNFWQTLAEVGFQSKKDKNGYLLEIPVFSKELKKWNGKRIRLRGYVIPVNEIGDQDKFMLSSMPFNVCYFCGAAGPETVVEVESNERIKFSSKAIWIEGVLYLNDSDADHHMYILKSAHTIPVSGSAHVPKNSEVASAQ